MPLEVSCQTAFFELKSFFPSTVSTKRASRNFWQTDLAISRAMEKVVVVVVVTMREGSLGSGIRLDWENLSEPRFVMASSDVKVWSIFWNLTRCAHSGKLTIKVENKSLKSCGKKELVDGSPDESQ